MGTFHAYHLSDSHRMWTRNSMKPCWVPLASQQKHFHLLWKLAITILSLNFNSTFWWSGYTFSKCSRIQRKPCVFEKAPVVYQKEFFLETISPWQACVMTTLTLWFSVSSSDGSKAVTLDRLHAIKINWAVKNFFFLQPAKTNWSWTVVLGIAL